MHICKVYGLPGGMTELDTRRLEENFRIAFSHIKRVGGLSYARQPLVFFPTDHLHFTEDTVILIEVDLHGKRIDVGNTFFDANMFTYKEAEEACNFLEMPFRVEFTRARIVCRLCIDGECRCMIEYLPEHPERLAVAS